MPTIPTNRNIIPQIEIARPDGTTWYDITDNINRLSIDLGSVDMIGTESGGGDSVVRQCSFEVINNRNSTADDSFHPNDRDSSINQFNGSYQPLLYPLREVVIRTAVEADQESGSTSIINEELDASSDGSQSIYETFYYPVLPDSETLYYDGVEQEEGTDFVIDYDTGEINLVNIPASGTEITIDYTYFRTMFHGYLGDRIQSSDDGHYINCDCRDEAKLLQDTYVENLEITKGNPAEDVIQEILDNNLEFTVNLRVPQPSGFILEEEVLPSDFNSVWDAIQAIATQRGWFLGYWYHDDINDFQLTFLAPPRDKDTTTADYTLTALDDIYLTDLDITDSDIRNDFKITYYDEEEGVRITLPDSSSDPDDFRDQNSIDAFRKKTAQFAGDNTYFISNRTDARTFIQAAIDDLSNLTAVKEIDMPYFPNIDLFSGLNIDDERISSEIEFFGIESIQHELSFQGGENSTLRTTVICSRNITGFHSKWLRMETRPGAGKPVEQRNVYARNYDVYVAANNSRLLSRQLADYICNGDQDEEQINKAINSLVEFIDYNELLYDDGIGEDNWEEGYTNIIDTANRIKEPTHLYLEADEAEVAYVTVGLYDLTNYDEITIGYEANQIDSGSSQQDFEMALIIDDDKLGDINNYIAKFDLITPFQFRRDVFDISALNGEHYIRIHIKAINGASGNLSVYDVEIDGVRTIGGGKVLLLEGEYSISAPIELESRVSIEGQGDSTVLEPEENINFDHIINIREIFNAKVNNLSIIGNGYVFYGVFIAGSNNITISNLIIQDFTGDNNSLDLGNGINFGSLIGVPGVDIPINEFMKVKDCRINNCKRGIRFGSTQGNLEDIIINNCIESGLTVGGTDIKVENISVLNISDPSGTGISIGSEDHFITNCKVRNANTGLILSSSSENCKVVGNDLGSENMVDDGTNNIIRNNVISDNFVEIGT